MCPLSIPPRCGLLACRLVEELSRGHEKELRWLEDNQYDIALDRLRVIFSLGLVIMSRLLKQSLFNTIRKTFFENTLQILKQLISRSTYK